LSNTTHRNLYKYINTTISRGADNHPKKRKMTYIIQDREAGNEIEECETRKEAEKIILEYEEQDKKEGTYKDNFYEIVKNDSK